MRYLFVSKEFPNTKGKTFVSGDVKAVKRRIRRAGLDSARQQRIKAKEYKRNAKASRVGGES